MRVEHGPTVTARGDDTGSLNPLSLARHGPSGLPSMRRPLGPGSRIPPPCRAAGPTTASRQGPAGSAGSPCRATALATVRTPACSPRTAVAMPRPSGTVSGKAGAPSVRAHYCRPLLPAPSKTASGPHTAPGGCAASRKGQCLKCSAPRGPGLRHPLATAQRPADRPSSCQLTVSPLGHVAPPATNGAEDRELQGSAGAHRHVRRPASSISPPSPRRAPKRFASR